MPSTYGYAAICQTWRRAAAQGGGLFREEEYVDAGPAQFDFLSPELAVCLKQAFKLGIPRVVAKTAVLKFPHKQWIISLRTEVDLASPLAAWPVSVRADYVPVDDFRLLATPELYDRPLIRNIEKMLARVASLPTENQATALNARTNDPRIQVSDFDIKRSFAIFSNSPNDANALVSNWRVREPLLILNNALALTVGLYGFVGKQINLFSLIDPHSIDETMQAANLFKATLDVMVQLNLIAAEPGLASIEL